MHGQLTCNYINIIVMVSLCNCIAFIIRLAELKGHTMAVTSVDWRTINGLSLLASCSDDQVSKYL